MDETIRQERMLICAKLGHRWALASHSEIRVKGDKREIFCVCRTCHIASWQEILPEKWDQFLRDMMIEAHAVSFMKG